MIATRNESLRPLIVERTLTILRQEFNFLEVTLVSEDVDNIGTIQSFNWWFHTTRPLEIVEEEESCSLERTFGRGSGGQGGQGG